MGNKIKLLDGTTKDLWLLFVEWKKSELLDKDFLHLAFRWVLATTITSLRFYGLKLKY